MLADADGMPPGREVVSDVLLPGPGDGPGGGAQDARAPGGDARVDAPAATDAGGRPDVPREAGPTAECDLLAPSCARPGYACYPVGDRPRCVRIETAGPLLSPCSDHDGCAAGSACIDFLCRALCDSSRPRACADGRCLALSGFAPVGTCEP
jgi:hypothetical protein